jgi:hypothetical protein
MRSRGTLLASAFPRVDPLEQSDILAAIAHLGWQPGEPDTMAAKAPIHRQAQQTAGPTSAGQGDDEHREAQEPTRECAG